MLTPVKKRRWLVIVAVAGAAAGGAAWGVRRGRAAARSGTPPELPPAPQPVAQPGPPRRVVPQRRHVVLVAGALAATVGIAAVAVSIHQPPDSAPETGLLADAANLYTPPIMARPTWIPTYSPPSTIPTYEPPPTMSTHSSLPTTPSTTSPPAPVPAGGVLPPDGSVMLTGDSGEEMTIKVVRIANPAPPIDPDNPSGEQLVPRIGYRLVSISVGIENTGGVPFLTDVEKHSWLVDKTGRTYTRNVEMTEARQLHPASQLDPESWNGREIVFEVRGDAELTRFRLSTHPGKAKQTQDWRLS